jgi:hypothetical protein
VGRVDFRRVVPRLRRVINTKYKRGRLRFLGLFRAGVRERERDGQGVKRKREAYRYMTREETARYMEEFDKSEVSKMNCLGQ